MDNIVAHKLLNSSAVVVSGIATILLTELPESSRDLLIQMGIKAGQVDEALYDMIRGF